jgi:hypothetical protein
MFRIFMKKPPAQNLRMVSESDFWRASLMKSAAD